MIHNHILDILRGRVTYPGVLIDPWADRKLLASTIRAADVFDFGVLPLQKNPGKEHYFLVPDLTDEEQSFFDEGLIPLPASICWYEFDLNGHQSALLVVKDNESIQVMRIDFDPGPNTGGIDAITVKRNPVTKDEFVLSGPSSSIKMLRDHGESYAGSFRLMEYMTLMLNSKTTEKRLVERIHAPEAKARNRHPVPEHRIVTIVPKRFIEAGATNGGTHTSPRLHWRRSHLREYKAPSGAVYHRVVIPRHLVGRAELGHVTHTYKVKHD